MKTSDVTTAFAAIAAIDPKWGVEIGQPTANGWIDGLEFQTASSGRFNNLLMTLGASLQTTDRRTIAASFALRYGWSSGSAIAGYLLRGCVPRIALDNISLRFSGPHVMFNGLALHQPQGVITVPRDAELLKSLRCNLIEQAEPIVEALQAWSNFSPKATWGLIVSSWGAQCSNIFGRVENQTDGAAFARALFAGDDVIARTQPRFYPVSYKAVTRMYYCSSSCCRYYLLPNKAYCASCPLISDEVRVERNVRWMKQSLGLD